MSQININSKGDEILNELQYLEDLDKSDAELLQRLRDEQILLSQLALKYYSDRQILSDTDMNDDNDSSSNIDEMSHSDGSIKRAPSAGFFGMRGKKLYYNSEGNKRSPSAGFFGMRGKKSVVNELLESSNADDGNEFSIGEEKRAPSVGFHGENMAILKQ